MSIKEDLLKFIATHKDLAAQMDASNERLAMYDKEITKIVEDRFSEAFPDVNVIYSILFLSWSATPSWAPCIQVIGATSAICSSHFWLKVKKLGWVSYTGAPADEVYMHKVVREAVPFDTKHLETVCSELSEELGIPVVVEEHKVSKVHSELRTVDDLLVKHPGAKVLEEGEIWYMGWDCRDQWVALETYKGIWIYYSTNAHGFGFDKSIAPGYSIKEFLDYIHVPDTTAEEPSEELLKRLKEQYGHIKR
jgi:8-oxo-dGTP pyrophosphatase MutT (NUDIX family)